ncbi:MAG: hypothetical protein CMH68_10250 [Nisaea sp.]|nr:hypothetical protein [Nisaea sp.]
MTDPESLQRVAVLEAQYAALRVKLREGNRKLDRLVSVAAMGRGAWAAIMKMGALLAVLVAAGDWAWDHLR